jgi:hypothetical protein
MVLGEVEELGLVILELMVVILEVVEVVMDVTHVVVNFLLKVVTPKVLVVVVEVIFYLGGFLLQQVLMDMALEVEMVRFDLDIQTHKDLVLELDGMVVMDIFIMK